MRYHYPSCLFVATAVISSVASAFSPLPQQVLQTSSSSSSSSSPSGIVRTFRSITNDNSSPTKPMSPSFLARGGDTSLASAATIDNDEYDLNITTGNAIASLWGTVGVAYILLKAVKRVLPIALEPVVGTAGAASLTNFQLASYILTCLFFAYYEGYKGFQLKFSPLVVARSFTLKPGTSPIHHLLLGPLYCMGLFHATKKRMIVSWSVTLGVASIVAAVKRLPYPWRNIVDAGVVVGLSWGTVSMLGGYLISLCTRIAPIGVDPALPVRGEKK